MSVGEERKGKERKAGEERRERRWDDRKGQERRGEEKGRERRRAKERKWQEMKVEQMKGVCTLFYRTMFNFFQIIHPILKEKFFFACLFNNLCILGEFQFVQKQQINYLLSSGVYHQTFSHIKSVTCKAVWGWVHGSWPNGLNWEQRQKIHSNSQEKAAM